MQQPKSCEWSTQIRPGILVIGAAMAVMGLSGCSGKDSDEQTASPPAANASATAPVAASGAAAAATAPGAKAPSAKTNKPENDGDD